MFINYYSIILNSLWMYKGFHSFIYIFLKKIHKINHFIFSDIYELLMCHNIMLLWLL